MRWLRRAGFGLALSIACYFVAAVAGAVIPGRSASMASADPEQTVEVLLVSGPIHYDFLLPATKDTLSQFRVTETAGLAVGEPWVRWLAVGWGAREFYTTVGSYRDLSANAVWRGLSGDRSVMQISAVGELRNDLLVKRLRLSQAQYRALMQNIVTYLARDRTGGLVPVPKAGMSRESAFFESNTRFHLFNTCNAWVGWMLREAGVKFGGWTPTPYAVTLSLWWFHSPA